jgi:hypothetical protein
VRNHSFSQLAASQANALAVVIELESLWENVPVMAAQVDANEGWRLLSAKQRAFDAYHTHRVAYNRQYQPAYHGERPVATPSRLGAWCRKMAALYRRLDHAECPVQLLKKAYRFADQLAARFNTSPCLRALAHTNTADAVAALGSIADWCDGLFPAKIPA